MATVAPSFLFGSSLFLAVTKTFIIYRMNSNFDKIRPLTAELSALECLKNLFVCVCVVATLAALFFSGSSSFLQVTRITQMTAELSALECLKNLFLCVCCGHTSIFVFQLSSNFGKIRPLTAELAAV